MYIKSNATPVEKTSPFYIENKNLCDKWEKFIIEKGGQIKGQFNAWSYEIFAKIETKYSWFITIQKATYSSRNLFLSSKYQNLKEVLSFETEIYGTTCKGFYIKKSRFKGAYDDHPFTQSIIELLKEGIKNESIYKIKFENPKLIIEIHHKNDCFEIVDQILKYQYHGR